MSKSESLDVADLSLQIFYNASDPALVTIDAQGKAILPAGRLRLWKKDGGEARNKHRSNNPAKHSSTLTSFGLLLELPCSLFSSVLLLGRKNHEKNDELHYARHFRLDHNNSVFS